MIAGPLALIGGGAFTDAQTVKRFRGNKYPLLVAAGHTVTIEVVGRQASLAYGSHSRTGQTSRPGCIELRIWVDRERTPRHARIALGKRC